MLSACGNSRFAVRGTRYGVRGDDGPSPMHRPSSEVAGASSGSVCLAPCQSPTQPNPISESSGSSGPGDRTGQQAAGSAPELEHSGRIRTQRRTQIRIQIQTQSPITSHQSPVTTECGPIPPATSPAQARARVADALRYSVAIQPESESESESEFRCHLPQHQPHARTIGWPANRERERDGTQTQTTRPPGPTLSNPRESFSGPRAGTPALLALAPWHWRVTTGLQSPLAVFASASASAPAGHEHECECECECEHNAEVGLGLGLGLGAGVGQAQGSSIHRRRRRRRTGRGCRSTPPTPSTQSATCESLASPKSRATNHN